jgi:ribonuclease J
MTSLTIFGGVDEIGGNKICLQEKNSRLFLDFGVSYRASDQYFDFPLLQPANLDDLLKTGQVPRLTGLYKNRGLTPIYDPGLGVVGVGGSLEQRDTTAVLLSHAHQDHYGYLGLLRTDIPVYTSTTTKKVLKLRNTVSGDFRDTVQESSMVTFESGVETQIGDFRVKRFDVDHSIPGASAFVVYTEAGAVGYTGDFRFHGQFGKLSEGFLDSIKEEKPKFLISEGTRLSQDSGSAEVEQESKVLKSEADVAAKCVDLLRGERGIAIYDASPADIGRVQLLAEVAKEAKRHLILDSKLGYFTLFLNANEPEPFLPGLPGRDQVEVLLGRRKLASNTKKYKALNQEDFYVETFDDGRDSFERELIQLLGNRVKWGPRRSELLRNPADYIVYTSNGPLTLLHLLPDGEPLVGLYIYGKAEPFTEEMEFSFARLLNWLKLSGLRLEYAHTSGHIFPKDLARFLGEANVPFVVPVHTVNAGAFAEMTASVLRAEAGVPIQL